MGVEHLVNCVNKDLIKFADMCVDNNKDHIVQSLFGDVFGVIANIGLLVASYFYFKRLARFSDSSVSSTSDSNSNSNEFADDKEYDSRECPKCNGTGRSLLNRGQLCGLCDGTGTLDLPPIRSLKLPRSRDNQS